MSIELIHADAVKWLSKQTSIDNVITGICDMDEIGMTDVKRYIRFFNRVVGLIFKKLADDGYAIFIQTDRKYNRQLISKSYLLMKKAEEFGLKTIWHKIVCHRAPNATDLYRPTYAHMLCFSKTGTTGAAFPDVLNPYSIRRKSKSSSSSDKAYKNSTSALATKYAIDFVKRYNGKTIVDPFVGRGTTVLLAREAGIDAVGVDIDENQVKHTMKLLNKAAKK